MINRRPRAIRRSRRLALRRSRRSGCRLLGHGRPVEIGGATGRPAAGATAAESGWRRSRSTAAKSEFTAATTGEESRRRPPRRR